MATCFPDFFSLNIVWKSKKDIKHYCDGVLISTSIKWNHYLKTENISEKQEILNTSQSFQYIFWTNGRWFNALIYQNKTWQQTKRVKEITARISPMQWKLNHFYTKKQWNITENTQKKFFIKTFLTKWQLVFLTFSHLSFHK